MMGFGLLLPILLLGILAYALGWIPNQQFGGRTDRSTPTDKRPLDLAQERYARGEITKEEYEEIRRELAV